MREPSEFSKKVLKLISQVPKGAVATYGQIAKLAGKPQGSRGVSWILHSSSKAYNLPWQRILGSSGKISFPAGSTEFKKQKKLLISEGIEFNEKNEIDLKKFQWKKTPSVKKTSAKGPRLFASTKD
ncbi:MGMT family protein [Bdellovibrio sp. HCB337]|uniref:MGMT family protein n=1 Tax=Bdellovibrio sp. HCB337 TaxID=3394358 RepID=UPI0039A5FB7A